MTIRSLSLARRAAVVGSLLALSLPAPSQEEQQVRTYDVGGLLRKPAGLLTEDSVPVVALPMGWVIPSEAGRGFSEFSRSSTFGTVVQVPNLRRVLHADELDRMLRDLAGEDAWCEGQSGLYRIQASEAAHARIRARLAALEGLLRHRMRVRVFSLEAPVDQAVFDREAAAALAAQGTSRLVFDQWVHADLPRILANSRFLSFTRDFDIEVAEKSKIGDPKIDGLFDGVRVGVDVSPMADGRHYVRLGLQRADVKEPMVSRDLGAEHLGAVDLPQVRVDEAVAAVAIEDGGGFAVGGVDGATWLVTVTRAGAAAASVPHAVPTAPLGLVDLPEVQLRRAFELPEDGGALFGFARPTPDDPLLRLDVLLGGALFEAEQPIERVASSLLIEDENLRSTVLEAVRESCVGLRTVTVQLAWGAVPADRLGGGDDAEQLSALAESMPHRWVLPTVPRQYFASSTGIERQFVRDYEVEIAKKAAGSNPVLDSGFSGLGFKGIVDARADGDLALRLDARWSMQDEPGAFDVKITGIGGLHVQDVVVVEFGMDDPVVEGQWNLVGTAPDRRAPGQQWVLLARIR